MHRICIWGIQIVYCTNGVRGEKHYAYLQIGWVIQCGLWGISYKNQGKAELKKEEKHCHIENWLKFSWSHLHTHHQHHSARHNPKAVQKGLVSWFLTSVISKAQFSWVKSLNNFVRPLKLSKTFMSSLWSILFANCQVPLSQEEDSASVSCKTCPRISSSRAAFTRGPQRTFRVKTWCKWSYFDWVTLGWHHRSSMKAFYIVSCTFEEGVTIYFNLCVAIRVGLSTFGSLMLVRNNTLSSNRQPDNATSGISPEELLRF